MQAQSVFVMIVVVVGDAVFAHGAQVILPAAAGGRR